MHDGYFWKGEPEVMTGIKAKRIQGLMKNDINLLAYHLPLDAHPILGNNAQLANQLGLYDCEPFTIDGIENLFWTGFCKQSDFSKFCNLIETKLERKPLVEKQAKKIHKIAWCTGAAQDYIVYAKEFGCDTFITGEASERTIHIARELGLNFISAGHHATERGGVKALGHHLASKFDLKHEFIDIENPV